MACREFDFFTLFSPLSFAPPLLSAAGGAMVFFFCFVVVVVVLCPRHAAYFLFFSISAILFPSSSRFIVLLRGSLSAPCLCCVSLGLSPGVYDHTHTPRQKRAHVGKQLPARTGRNRAAAGMEKVCVCVSARIHVGSCICMCHSLCMYVCI